MKKIFYFIASAIVALGAVACQNDIDENIDNNQQTEGLSIKVTIDEQTRVELGQLEDNKRKLTFTEGDVLVARANRQSGTSYFFTYTKTEGDVYTFTCTAEGVSSLVGTKPCFFYLGGLHEQADELTIYGSLCNTAAEDLSGIGLSATSYDFDHNNKNLGEEGHMVSLHALPLLKFTANEPVTFKSTNPSQFFVNGWADSYTTKKTGEIYLPIMTSGGECTVTVTTESGFNKAFTTMFEENKIYNLGTIELKKSEWAIIGSFAQSNWSDIAMYETGAFAVATNITLAKNNAVKFRKYSWDNDKQRTCCTAFNLNDITFVKNDGSESPACNLDGTYDIYIPKTNAGYVIVVEAGKPLPETVPTKISLIGDAVGGWNAANDVMLTWDKNTALFKVTNKTVTANQIKIRANQGWDHSWGSGGAWTVGGQNEIWYNGGNSSIVAGTYDFYTNLKAVSVVTAGSATPSL